MFRLAEHSPREAVGWRIDFGFADELWFMPYSRGTSGEGLRLEWVLPSAPRIAGGNEFTKAKPLFPFDESNQVPAAYKQITIKLPSAFKAGKSTKFRLLTSR